MAKKWLLLGLVILLIASGGCITRGEVIALREATMPVVEERDRWLKENRIPPTARSEEGKEMRREQTEKIIEAFKEVLGE